MNLSIGELIPNLYDKHHYVILFHNLKKYIRLGLDVTYVHRVLKFTQSAWLKPYITLNTEKRKAATIDFEKNFYKLMNNATFGR